jgi:hypothetical protein
MTLPPEILVKLTDEYRPKASPLARTGPVPIIEREFTDRIFSEKPADRSAMRAMSKAKTRLKELRNCLPKPAKPIRKNQKTKRKKMEKTTTYRVP